MKDEMHKQVLNKWQKGEMNITKNIKQIAKELISKNNANDTKLRPKI